MQPLPSSLNHPLIPANAGTQIIGRDRLGWRLMSARARRFTIWVPAFAGMSGYE